MAADKDLVIKITAETDRAVKEIKELTKEVKKFSKIDDTTTKTSKSTDKLNKSFTSLGLSMRGLVGGAAVLGAAMKAVEFAEMAASAEQSAESFKLVFEDMGLVAEEEFQKIKEASKDLIPDSAIKQSAVTAASLGVPIEKLAELMEVARVKAREMGTDAQSAFNDLATGIGRGSPMILDNLGLTIKLGEANKALATEIGKSVDDLTKQEKAMALTNAVIDAGAASVERYANAELTAKQRSQQFDAAMTKLKEKVGGALLPAMNSLTQATTSFINAIVDDDDAAVKGLDEVKKKVEEINNSMLDGKPKAMTEEIKKAVEQGFDIGGESIITLTDKVSGAVDNLVLKPKVEADEESIANFMSTVDSITGEETNIYLGVKPDEESMNNFMKIVDEKTGKGSGRDLTINTVPDVSNFIKIFNEDGKTLEKSLEVSVPVLIDKEKTVANFNSTIKEVEKTAEVQVPLKYTEDMTLKDFVKNAESKTPPVIVDVQYRAINTPSSLNDQLNTYGGQ